MALTASAQQIYYVAPDGNDAAPGTEAEPWRTIEMANATLLPGDTVYLKAGTYDDPIRPHRSGTDHDNRITYRAFGDGDVVLRNFDGPDETRAALALSSRRYISVSGRSEMDEDDVRRIKLVNQGPQVPSMGNVCAGEGNIVENISFQCQSGASGSCNYGFAFCLPWWQIADQPTRYNVLRNCEFVGASNSSGDASTFTEDLVRLSGNAQFNLIENNILTNANHTVLYLDSDGRDDSFNVVRNNSIYNPNHTALSIFDDSDGHLIENNDLRGAAETTNPDTTFGNSLQVGFGESIVRYNTIYEGCISDCSFAISGGLAGGVGEFFVNPTLTQNRVYNNTIVDQPSSLIALSTFGDPGDLGDSVYVNNIFFGASEAGVGRNIVYEGTSSVPGGLNERYIANMIGNPGGVEDGDIVIETHSGTYTLPQAVASLGGSSDADFSPWNGYRNRYQAAPGFVDYDGNDFSLTPDSPLVDAGAPLTQVASGDSGSGTILRVVDTRFFYGEASGFPAWMGVENDWIAVGPDLANAVQVQIVFVDDGSNTMALSNSISRQAGDFVWLWRDSDGTELISGNAPDVGAQESEYVANHDVVAPTAPANVSGTILSESIVRLAWEASSDNIGVAAYRIRRDGGLVGTTSGLFFEDASLEAGTTYIYRVAAVDAAGNESVQSSPLAVAMPEVATVSVAGGSSGSGGGGALDWLVLLSFGAVGVRSLVSNRPRRRSSG
ncbi:MAG: hypothetical protein QNJ73_07280 [Gammaproteobacteria bacterium]|nr:hypothetical protein [Gammaproteobacteria bacterium]